VDPWPFVIAALASYRLTRFVVTDSLPDPVRRRIFRRFPPDEMWAKAFPRVRKGQPVVRVSKVGQLLDCPFCTGWWMAGLSLAVAYALGYTSTRPATLLGLWWALAGAQGLLNALDGRLSR